MINNDQNILRKLVVHFHFTTIFFVMRFILFLIILPISKLQAQTADQVVQQQLEAYNT